MASTGVDEAVLDGLRSRRLDGLPVLEPSADQLEGQLREELAEARRHLRVVLDHYWDNDWRRRHKGQDESPQDHLWRAAKAVSEMLDAVDRLRP